MRVPASTSLAILLGSAILFRGVALGSSVIFQDGFESGSLGVWDASTSNNGRVVASANYAPASGFWQLMLDDSVNDALYSVAEASLQLDLTAKKNVVLAFKAKSLGNEPDAPPSGNFSGTRNFDAVTISVDGGMTWRSVQSLAGLSTAWTTFSIPLDGAVTALGGSFGPDFRIRISEFDNAPAPLDGIAVDDVSVTADDDQRVILELPAQIQEGEGPATGYVLLAFAPAQPLLVNLTATPPGNLTMPTNVTVSAGQTFANFSFSAVDDNLVNLTRLVSISPSATGATTTASSIVVLDNEVPVGTLTVPGQLTEGALPVNNAILTLDRPPTTNFVVNLTANPANELTIPSTVTVASGQTQAVFTVRALDDGRIDGNVIVSLTASNANMAAVTAQITTLDNETRALSIGLPLFVSEGSSASAVVTITGTLTTNLNVGLTSADEAILTVPTSVTIPAGQTQASFIINAMDNLLRDGSRSVAIFAAASAFVGTNRSVTIRDNDPAGYRFSTLSNIVNVSSPLVVSISAVDVAGTNITGYTGAVNITAVFPDGSQQPVTPATVNLSNGVWSGSLPLPLVSTAPLRLRATDVGGYFGESSLFDIMRVLNVVAADLVWDAGRNRIYASVPASSGTNANMVVAIDPRTGQVVTNVFLGQDPKRLALTSGGEFLYAALNGNGTVARINPDTMSVLSSFAVGTDPSYGTLYVEDMCTVAGQPNLLIISQQRLSVSPRHNGVAAYDNGVMRPTKTQDHTGSNIIEPSSDPAIFFGYNTETTEYGFRRLQLSASGMTQLQVDGSLFNGFSIDMRSDGNKVFSTSGVAVDGAQMRRLGTFPTSGPVCPDLSVNRVFFLESPSPYYYPYEYDKIGAYDPTTLANIRSLSLPYGFISPKSFIRWGTNGLAFLSETNVVLINSSQMVPSSPPADLAVTIQASPNPASIASPLAYSICVSNLGPNLAKNSVLSVSLSDSQTIQSVMTTNGPLPVIGTNMTITLGDIPSGTCCTVTVVTLPISAGGLFCLASATSDSIDSNSLNNSAAKVVSVGFQAGINIVNPLRLPANNLIYDPTRNLLWATIPGSVSPPLGKSIVAIDPTTGLISNPLPINGNPTAECMALSLNGRYLYVGLTDAPEIHRVDLNTPGTSLRIPLGLSQWGDANYAEDIEPLVGDGTSFLMTGFDDHAAAVFDGTIRRTTRTGIYTVDRIERTGNPTVFIGYNNYTSGFGLSRLIVSASGVVITQSVGSVVSGYYADIRGEGSNILSSTGKLVDSTTLTLRANLSVGGRPCVDGPNNRAYIVNGASLYAFDASTGSTAGSFALPVTQSGDWAQRCIRWGLDGFGIVGNDDRIYIARWSNTIPAQIDSDNDGIADAWEASYFGSLSANLAGDDDGDLISNFQEFLFGSSPLQADVSPLLVSTTNVANQTYLRLVFPRRAGILQPRYGFMTSTNLAVWEQANTLSETILHSQTINNVQFDTVEALIPASNASRTFARFRWLVP